MNGSARKALALLLAALAVSPSWAEDALGDWGGTLLGRLRLVVNVQADSGGHFVGTLESLDQHSAVLQLADITADGERLHFAAPKAGGQFEGRWNADRTAWVGTWAQGGQTMPLALARMDPHGAKPEPRKRPQEEAIANGSWPYTVQDVHFDNAAAGVTLAGTFSAPLGQGPFPTLVLIAGSGANARDEEVFGHKIFMVLADALNRAGMAVLRYDKRGVGGSTGSYASATSDDFAGDARAALAYLRTRADVDSRHLGLLGHSEGGVIAPQIAADDPAVAFVVLLAGPGVNGERILLTQKALILRANGAPEAQIAQAVSFNRRAFDIVAQSQSVDDALQQLKAAFDPLVASQHITRAQADILISQVTSPWMRFFLRYDPAPRLKKVTVPVLALNGALDLQVEPAENLSAIRQALAGNKDATVLEMPGLNHLFQTAKTGAPTEYGAIEETMSATALNTITAWVAGHVQK